MKVIYHHSFTRSYCFDPAAREGRIESIVRAISGTVDFVEAVPASREDIAACHSAYHIRDVERQGLYDIASLAAGGAIQAALTGLREPCFALIRPPGHHASVSSSWGFCFFNNMAIAITKLKREALINKAYILDFDLHFGDGTVRILGHRDYVTIVNPVSSDRNHYLAEVERSLPDDADIIGVSAGFDNHREDWGGVLSTEDYRTIGQMVRQAAVTSGSGCFAVLEGGYNHEVLGDSVMALIDGMRG
jgi:acetoin utilization deacetylase AcuC-like enzyme